jgi:hypothetical protein
MGFFAFKTSDTNKTFISKWGENLGVDVINVATILLPNGEKFTGIYDGYGRITNTENQTIDIFSAIVSSVQESIDDEKTEKKSLRQSFFIDEDYEKNCEKIKIVENSELNFNDVPASQDCRTQGYFSTK